MLFITCRRKREKNDNKEIVHKWFTLGISGEIYDKSLFESFCSIKKRRPDWFRQRIKVSDNGWIQVVWGIVH